MQGAQGGPAGQGGRAGGPGTQAAPQAGGEEAADITILVPALQPILPCSARHPCALVCLHVHRCCSALDTLHDAWPGIHATGQRQTCCASCGTTQTCFLLRLQLHSMRLSACRRSIACAFLQAAAGIKGGYEGGLADLAEQPAGGGKAAASETLVLAPQSSLPAAPGIPLLVFLLRHTAAAWHLAPYVMLAGLADA